MDTVQVIVVGGGVAGCTAALEAARRGLKVMLIDEHPQSLAAMSFDAPYFYGSRLSAVLSDSSAIAERVLGANPLLLDCLDAGVDVLTNTCVWGNFVPGPNLTYTEQRRLGLADAERSWLVPYEHLILAPGARDLVLSFPGWQLPGVLGAEAASALVTRYQALGGSRAVILGSGNTGLRLAKQLREAQIEVAGIVEVAESVRGDAALRAELETAGVPFRLSSVIDRALGDREVEGVQIRSLNDRLEPIAGTESMIACDTVCIAIGVIPNIELAAQSSCRIEYDSARGGWVPVVDADQRTSIPYIYVIGDGAGINEGALLNPDLATDQARRAVEAIAGGRTGSVTAAPPGPKKADAQDDPSPAGDWLRALIGTGGLDVVACQCEEVTRREVLCVQAPRYLGAPEKNRAGPITPDNQTSQDFVKRMTRAGMGHCQGKRCRDHIALLLATAAGRPISQIVPGSYRVPVRPLPLGIAAGPDESDEITRSWPVWFQPLHEGEIS